YTQSLFGRPELEGLDGELVVGNPWDKNLMQQTSSGVMSYAGRPNVAFFVFDKWNSTDPFFVRQLFAFSKHDGLVRGVPHDPVTSYEDMLVREQLFLQEGYEGVMLRHPHGPYKQNRSTL